MSILDVSGNAEFPQRGKIIVGEGEHQVPVKLVKEVFTELTEKSESLDKSFKKPYRIKFEDIEQLHHKITQTINQYNVINQSLRFVIYYSDNTKDELKSFESASKLSANSSSQVESIYLKYEFIIHVPSTKKLETYSMALRMVSPIAMSKRMKNISFFSPPPPILRVMGARTALLKIDYADYTVARSLQTTVIEWFSAIECASENKFMRFLQKNSLYIPRLLAMLLVLLNSFFFYDYLRFVDASKISSNVLLLKFLILFFVFTTLFLNFSIYIGRFIENSIDGWTPVSYIMFNKRDETEMQKFVKVNHGSLIRAAVGGIVSGGTSLIGKVVLSYILKEII